VNSCAATDDEKSCAAKENASEIHRELIEWMREEDAFVGEKQEVRLLNSRDPWSGYGVFATKRIEAKEKLLSVPFDIFLHSNVEEGSEYRMPCGTIKQLLEEMDKGDESEFAPYVRYLQSIANVDILPDGWSNAGQEMLSELLGKKLPPQDYDGFWLDEWTDDDSCDGENDPHEKEVALLVMKLMEDGYMVPYSDFFNHRNGHWTNAEIGMFKRKRLEIMSTRTIHPGEQIYTSNNMCEDCEFREKNGYGTPHMLRDYGFVEELPQRWTFQLDRMTKVVDVAEKEDGSGELELSWVGRGAPLKRSAYQLRETLEHLDRFEEEYQENTSDVPENEWKVVKKYHAALTVVNELILDDLIDDEDNFNLDEERNYWARHDDCFYTNNYVPIEPFHLNEYEDCESSMFQKLCYGENPKEKNKCFDLDGHIQMCADHRPHYHEPFVHFTASYLKELKRVAFVGGGDNMILHEVLKYPTVEFVIGLELDQKTVRKSFKHFHTQPHFEDERVQWWFGDATKSLTMLPKEYFGSFDLVLVDLSETATSLTVTDHLDMFDALSLLVKPDGIFVKNEIYSEKLSTLFDHTITLYEDHVPMVCKQDFSMGSNNIDFLKPNFELTKKYKPETYVYKPLEDINTHYRILRDYSKNDARAQGKCEKLDENTYDSDEQRRAGIVMIVEAENATGANMPAEKLEKALTKAIKKGGATVLSAVVQPSQHGGSIAIMSLKEGYIVAHTWPKHNYVGLEIHLWSQFGKLENIKNLLLKSVGSTKGPWSTYRIVAGGMLGTDNWKEEQATIGPRPIQTRDCEPHVETSPDETTLGIVMEESLSLIEKKDTTALVLCGDSTKGVCKTLEALKEKGIKNLVSVWTCPEDENGESGNSILNGVAKVILCGHMDSIDWMDDIVTFYDMIGFVAVDPEASHRLIRSVTSLFREDESSEDIDSILTDNAVIVVPILDESDKPRMTLVNESRTRREVSEYVAVHEITVGPMASGMKVWFTATRHPAFLSDVADVASSIKNRTGIEAAVTGNKLDIIDSTVPFDGYYGTMDDYETVPGLIQFSNQLPLGFQSIYQFEYKKKAPLSATKFKGILERILAEMNLSVTASAISSESGDGSLIAFTLKAGHAIVLWDGGTHVDTNLFTYDETIQHKDVFAEKFMEYVEGLEYVLRDEMPRGTGHVVNSMDEIGTRTPGCYDLYQFCAIYAERGNCVKEKSWMESNCMKSCGLC